MHRKGLQGYSSSESGQGVPVAPTEASRTPSGQTPLQRREEAELKVLEGKLELLQLQRELCAIKCQTFLEYLEREVQREKAQGRGGSVGPSGARVQLPASKSVDYSRRRKGKHSRGASLRRKSESLSPRPS